MVIILTILHINNHTINEFEHLMKKTYVKMPLQKESLKPEDTPQLDLLCCHATLTTPLLLMQTKSTSN